jgi:hypothetical protein
LSGFGLGKSWQPYLILWMHGWTYTAGLITDTQDSLFTPTVPSLLILKWDFRKKSCLGMYKLK